MAQFHFDPDFYLELMAAEVPAYARLQDEVAGGPFERVFSALAVHHLDGPGKAGLFAHVAWTERDLAVLIATRA